MSYVAKYNHLTDKETIEKINPDNKQLLADYLEYLKSIQRSPATIDVYRNDLEICFCWCVNHARNKAFVNWTKRDVIALQNWLINENENSPARVRRIKATLSSLSNYIEAILDDEYPDFRNIIHKVENPVAQPVREKVDVTDEQLQTVLDRFTESGDYNKACMLALAMYSGRRKSELVRFRVSDFSDDNLMCDGALYKTTEPIKTKGRGLGKFIYCYTLAKEFKPYLDNWMKYREEHGIESEWLFPAPDDPTKQMNPQTFTSWSNTISRMLGTRWHPHAARHRLCTYFVKAGLPENIIQEIFGWSSADMVKVYTDIDADEQISEWFKGGKIRTDNRMDKA